MTASGFGCRRVGYGVLAIEDVRLAPGDVVVPPDLRIEDLSDFADIEFSPLPHGDRTHTGGKMPLEALVWPVGDRRAWPRR